MREFAKPSFSLRAAPRPLRLVYAAFLVLIVPGILTQIAFQLGRIGVAPGAIAVYYRGSEQAEVMAFPKTFGQLAEITHAHAFVMGIVFLILAHLALGTSVSERTKAIALTLTFAGVLGDLVSPWLVRYVAAGWAWLVLASWLAQTAGIVALIAIGGWECVGWRSTHDRDLH
jgi:hypothetical protein